MKVRFFFSLSLLIWEQTELAECNRLALRGSVTVLSKRTLTMSSVSHCQSMRFTRGLRYRKSQEICALQHGCWHFAQFVLNAPILYFSKDCHQASHGSGIFYVALMIVLRISLSCCVTIATAGDGVYPCLSCTQNSRRRPLQNVWGNTSPILIALILTLKMPERAWNTCYK